MTKVRQTSLSCFENFQQLSDSFRCKFGKILQNFAKLLPNFVHLETFSRLKKVYVSADLRKQSRQIECLGQNAAYFRDNLVKWSEVSEVKRRYVSDNVNELKLLQNRQWIKAVIWFEELLWFWHLASKGELIGSL